MWPTASSSVFEVFAELELLLEPTNAGSEALQATLLRAALFKASRLLTLKAPVVMAVAATPSAHVPELCPRLCATPLRRC
mmetsp:Transcript_1066/g.2175  ORF Transcript_1066/g.2175 Transcript_1066/m.2175 type:complete len:80 (-) Transcript_1066:143-382(-)